MDRAGNWSLAPAYDVVYAYNPDGPWTSQHQMSLAGKTDGFEIGDLMTFARFADLKTREAKGIISDVRDAVSRWQEFSVEAGVPEQMARMAGNGFRRF